MLLGRLVGVASFSVAASALSLTGCFGSKSDGVDRGSLLGEMLSTVCSSVATCCDTASLDLDNRKCHDDVILHMSASIGDPQLTYDQAAAEACLDTIRASVAACQTIDYSPCIRAFTGHGMPGAPCSSGLDCVAGANGYAVCSQDGHCAQPTRGNLNEPCSYSCLDGPDGADCKGIYSAAAPGGAEVACHANNGLACVGGGVGATCQSIANDCRVRPEPQCIGGGICDPTTGACLAPAPLGAPCAPSTPSSKCVPGAYCGSGVCQPQKGLNALCADSTECGSLRCDQGLCVTFSPVASTMCLAPGR